MIHGERIRESPGIWRRPRMLLGQCAHGETTRGTAYEDEPNKIINYSDTENQCEKIDLD